jgi:hypothetical protein
MNADHRVSALGELDGNLGQAVAAVLAEPAPADAWRRVEAAALHARPQRRTMPISRGRRYAAAITAVALLLSASIGMYSFQSAYRGAQPAAVENLANSSSDDADRSHHVAGTDATGADAAGTDAVEVVVPKSPTPPRRPSVIGTAAYVPSNLRAVVAESAPVLVANGSDTPVSLGDRVPYFAAKDSLHVWNWERSEHSRVVKDFEFGTHHAAALSPDGRIVVRADGEVLDLTSGEKSKIELGGAATRIGEAVYGRIGDMRFSPDGRRIAMLVTEMFPDVPGRIAGEFVDVVEFPSGKRTARFPAGEAYALRLGFSADGKQIFAGTPGLELQRRSTATGEVVTSYEPAMEHQILAVAVAPDLRHVACSDRTGLRIWECETGRLVHRVKYAEADAGAFGCLQFSPDGKHLALARTFDVQVYETASGRAVATLRQSVAIYLRWSADGDVLTTVSAPAIHEESEDFVGERFDVYPFIDRWDWKRGRRLMSAAGRRQP